jgi:hypothetical protein
MIVELEKNDGSYSIKRNATFHRAICCRFVGKVLKSRPKKIRVHFRDINPKKSGWIKARLEGGHVKIGLRSRSGIYYETENFLLNRGVGRKFFWFKVESGD